MATRGGRADGQPLLGRRRARRTVGPERGVRAGIEQSYARWDGQGVPRDLAGDALALSARISHIAEACEVFQRAAGVEQAVEMVRSRSGTHFDPEVAAAVARDPEALFECLDHDTVDEILDRADRAAAAERRRPGPGVGGDRGILRPALPVLRRAQPGHGGAGGSSSCAAAPGALGDDACPTGRARPRRGTFRCARLGVGQTRTAHQQRRRAHADARLLRGADLQPAGTAPEDRSTGGDAPRAHGRLRLSPRDRRHHAVHVGTSAGLPPTPITP